MLHDSVLRGTLTQTYLSLLELFFFCTIYKWSNLLEMKLALVFLSTSLPFSVWFSFFYTSIPLMFDSNFVCVRDTLLHCKYLALLKLFSMMLLWWSYHYQVTSSTLCISIFEKEKGKKREKKILMDFYQYQSSVFHVDAKYLTSIISFSGLHFSFKDLALCCLRLFPLTSFLNSAIMNCFICLFYFKLDPDCIYISLPLRFINVLIVYSCIFLYIFNIVFSFNCFCFEITVNFTGTQKKNFIQTNAT